MLEVALQAAVDADPAVRGSAVRLVANKLYQMPLLTNRVSYKPYRPSSLAYETSEVSALRLLKQAPPHAALRNACKPYSLRPRTDALRLII